MPQTHLQVRMLSHTPQPEQTVAMAARICYAGCDIGALEQRVAQSDAEAFIAKLLGLGHLSPFEHVSFTFGVEGVSRALLAQLTRHRIASFSVQSQRYVEMGKEAGFGYILPPAVAALGPEAQARFETQMRTMQAWYDEWREALSGGKSALEDARFVLPNACETKLLVTMNARELLHFFELRCCMRAQWEIRAMAWAMLGLCLRVAPSIFGHAGPNCLRRGCTEGAMSCGSQSQVRIQADELAGIAPTADDAGITLWARERIS